jgi:1,2-dihydroxy-3-keto-5-methylthiopentene dioxygenase
LNLDTPEGEESLAKIKRERGYSYEDQIEISPEKLPNYEEKVSCSPLSIDHV